MSKEALDYPKRALFLIPPEDLTIIGLDTSDGVEHPLADPNRVRLPLQESSVLHMMSGGFIPPILVAKDGDRIVVVEGRQRTRAGREANKRLVAKGEQPLCLFATYSKADVDQLMDAMVSTNSHRQPDDILDLAEKAHRMFERGRDVNTIAIRQNVSGQTIRQRLKLHGLHPQLKEAVRDGACTVTDALTYSEKSQVAQREAGLAFLAAVEDPKPRKQRGENEPEAPARIRRKRRGEKTIRKALIGAPPAKAATLAFILDPEAKVSALLEHDPAEVIHAFAWVYGEDEINEEGDSNALE